MNLFNDIFFTMLIFSLNDNWITFIKNSIKIKKIYLNIHSK